MVTTVFQRAHISCFISVQKQTSYLSFCLPCHSGTQTAVHYYRRHASMRFPCLLLFLLHTRYSAQVTDWTLRGLNPGRGTECFPSSKVQTCSEAQPRTGKLTQNDHEGAEGKKNYSPRWGWVVGAMPPPL